MARPCHERVAWRGGVGWHERVAWRGGVGWHERVAWRGRAGWHGRVAWRGRVGWHERAGWHERVACQGRVAYMSGSPYLTAAEPAALELGLTTFADVTADPDGRLLSHAETLRDVLDQGILADEVGVDFFGVGEHHRAEFAVSAPEVVLAAIAGRTRRIRLGSAVTVLSTDDPVRVFQRFSTLHALAGGRVEVILGRGAFTESFPLFGYALSDYSTLFEEKLDLFMALLRHDAVTWHGTTRPPLSNQRVYPPIAAGGLKTWLAVGSTPESVLRAVRYDLPLMLGIVGGEPQRFKPFVEIYRQGCEKLRRPPGPIGAHSPGYVADTDELAREEYWAAYQPARDRLGIERGWPPITRAKFNVEVERGALYVGSPETVARRIADTLHQLGLSRFDLKYSTGTLEPRKLLHAIELYGEKVMPRVRQLLADAN
jgi:probable LLM family oxidoreductase